MERTRGYSHSRGPCPVYLQITEEKSPECPPGHRRVKLHLPGWKPAPEQKIQPDPTKNCISAVAGTDCPCTCCLDKFCRCDGLPSGKKCPCWFCKREQGKKVVVNG